MALPRARDRDPPGGLAPAPERGGTEGQKDGGTWGRRLAGAEGGRCHQAGAAVRGHGAVPAAGRHCHPLLGTAPGTGGPASLGLWHVCLGGQCHPHPGTPALWEATQVLMLLSVLAAAAGLALGISVVLGGARRVRARMAGATLLLAGLLALLGLSVYTAGTLSLLGPAHPAWRFSWSYILGWVAVVLTSSAGLFHLCAAAKDLSPESSEVEGT